MATYIAEREGREHVPNLHALVGSRRFNAELWEGLEGWGGEGERLLVKPR